MSDELQQRAKRGITLLTLRQIALQVLMFGGGVILARTLEPAEFGIYAIVTFLIGTFSLFGDFGLAPSFIQRKEELTNRDLSVGFTLQQILTSIIVVAICCSASLLAKLYPKITTDIVWLIRALAFSLYLTSWRAMSALQLERHLRYDRLAWIEVVTTLSYQVTVVTLALLKFGVWSFIWGLLLSQSLAVILVYAAAPWPVRFAFDKKIAKETLAYGIPFQIQGLVNQMQHWVTPTLVAALAGPAAVGYLTWAGANGKRPLVLVDNVMRVAFPHFSRLQDDPHAVQKSLTKYLMLLLVVSGLWFSLMVTSGPLFVRFIYTEKWSGAVPALIMYAGLVAFDTIAWVVGVTLNGLGKISFFTRYLLIRHLLITAAGTLLVFRLGFNGVPLASLIVGALMTPAIFKGLGQGAFRRVMSPSRWILWPTAASILLGCLSLRLPLGLVPQALLSLIVTIATFTAVSFVTAPAWLRALAKGEMARYSGMFGLKAKWRVKEQEV